MRIRKFPILILFFTLAMLFPLSAQIFSDTYFTLLPAGTNGTAGTSARYVLFGDWPQSPLRYGTKVDESISVQVGAFTYYYGSDDYWYAKADNGYYKVEPIKWRIVTDKYNGKTMILSENTLMLMQWYDESSANSRTIDGKEVYDNNYEHSRIRAFLNGLSYPTKKTDNSEQLTNEEFLNKGFLQTAFSENARTYIADTKIENSPENSATETGFYTYNTASLSVSNDTVDKVFILSRKEATSKSYGFGEFYETGYYSARLRTPVAFAEALVDSDNEYKWWLRSPYAAFYSEPLYVDKNSTDASILSSLGVAVGEERTLFIETAKSYMGVPYVYGGLSRSGIDCSGLTYLAAQAVNLKIPRTAALQYESSERIKESERQPGDLVFFSDNGKKVSHVGIYMGDGKMLNSVSSGTNTGVVISSLSAPYWTRTYYGSGRIFKDSTASLTVTQQGNSTLTNAQSTENSPFFHHATHYVFTVEGSGSMSLSDDNGAESAAGDGYYGVVPALCISPDIPVLKTIEVASMPTKTTYDAGEELDLTGLTIAATYSDGSKKPLTKYTVSGFDSNKEGTHTLTIHCSELLVEKDLKINYKVVFPVIEISSMPTKTTYKPGEMLDLSGLVITSTSSDGTKKNTTSYTVSGFNSNTEGTHSLTIHYSDRFVTKDFNIDYKVVFPVIEISSMPTKTTYNPGEKLNLSGLVITAKYYDGSKKTITNYTTSGFNSEIAGTHELTIHCNESSIEKDITLNYTVSFPFKGTFTGQFTGTEYTELPKGTDGSIGTKGRYVLFGDWPQTKKASYISIDETKKVTSGSNTYYLGSDGYFYAKTTENAYESYYRYSDGTLAETYDQRTSYFKVEPIKWRIVTDDMNGNALLVAENVLTTCPWYKGYDYRYSGGDTSSHRYINKTTVYPNNYEYSTIRAFLNGLSYYSLEESGSHKQFLSKEFQGRGFLQTAFSKTAQSQIVSTEVDNSAESTQRDERTSGMTSRYLSNNTKDKIFLLSVNEITKMEYGFSDTSINPNAISRSRILTDFAKAQGACCSAGFDSSATGIWWLRSPYDSFWQSVYRVDHSFVLNERDDISSTCNGVVPALCIPSSMVTPAAPPAPISIDINTRSSGQYTVGTSDSWILLDIESLIVNYNDGSSKEVLEYTAKGFNTTKAGKHTVTISYTENNVTVDAKLNYTITGYEENPSDKTNNYNVVLSYTKQGRSLSISYLTDQTNGRYYSNSSSQSNTSSESPTNKSSYENTSKPSDQSSTASESPTDESSYEDASETSDLYSTDEESTIDESSYEDTNDTSDLSSAATESPTITNIPEGAIRSDLTINSGATIISNYIIEKNNNEIKTTGTSFLNIGKTSYKKQARVSDTAGTGYTELPAGTDGSVGPGGKYVLFGEWPQSQKESNVIINETKTKNVGAFTYYLGSDKNWYVEVYYMYFKVEPIKWRVLTDDYNGNTLLLAENALIDCQFYDYVFNRTINGKVVYPNNYEHSKIRAYLNGLSYITKESEDSNQTTNRNFLNKGFLQTAFNEAAQKVIVPTLVDNSAGSTTDSSKRQPTANRFVCSDTTDKIFLLSEKEISSAEYGFLGYEDPDDYRIRRATDFLSLTGEIPYSDWISGRYWWLRSPHYYSSTDAGCCVRQVLFNGKLEEYDYINDCIDVVPALCIAK